MAQRIISVSISEGDKGFMKSKWLSPSKLLQERITQIRDAENPQLIKNLNEQRRQKDNVTKKLNFFQNRIFEMGKAISEKYGEKELDKILDKI